MKLINAGRLFAPLVAPDEHDRFFLIPRLLLFAGAAFWLFSTAKQMRFLAGESHRLILGVFPLLVMFVFYTVMFQFVTRRYPHRRRSIYQASTAADVAFITLLISATGSCQSNFYIAYYPFIALGVFYFGLAGGALVTFLSGAAYLFIYIRNSEQLFIGDFALRLGFMFLVFLVLAYLEENAKSARYDIEKKKNMIDTLNSRLEERYQELVDDREALADAVKQKESLLNSQNIITARRRSHISFARELNAQSDVAKTIELFSRYSRGLLEVDRVDIIILKKEPGAALLFPDEPGEESQEIPLDHALVKKVLDEADQNGFFEVSWNSAEAHEIPYSLLITPRQPAALHIETLTGGRMGLTGILIVSSYDDYYFDADLMDELKILCSHLTVAIENMSLRKKLQDMADTDGLTGIYNHRYFQQTLDREIDRTRRYSRPLSLMMIDIDHFKKLNDAFGHQTGDAVLRELGMLVKNMLRITDVFCRYGGEEFVVIMPETDPSAAFAVAERIRRAVEKHNFRSTTGKPFGITISLGIGSIPPAEEKKQLVKAADDALYRAKESGRNCVAS